jgi:hypothetical protein
MRCLPGMEGAPILAHSSGAFLGVLGVPLSNRAFRAEACHSLVFANAMPL